jgi:N-acyl homoserine lactone hydrolase
MANYSIWAVEFSRLPGYPDSALVYGKSEGSRTIPFLFYVVQSDDHVVLVDCGFSDNEYCQGMMDAYGIEGWQRPDLMLERLGITGADVDAILVTHHHFDHVSGVPYFPNAKVYIQQRDVDNWMEKWGAPEPLKWLVNGLDPNTAADLASIGGQGRLRLVDGVADVLPGIQVRPAFDTHTAGSQYIVLEPNDGGDPWVFTGDVANVYDNIGGPDGTERMMPVGLAQGSQECCVRATWEMKNVANHNMGRILPSHEIRIWDRFPTKVYDDGIHIAEIELAPGVASRIG